MDLSKLSDITAWDVRNVYNKVKNVVMNYTEMEIKVNEATGPEPWGASSTLMREIADATFSPQSFNEIMPAIYMKFNDTDPSNWRQVYKALQLIEYLVKSGSERVVDDVRGHITIIKMLRNFHHIDENSKDQGINVRQRAKELIELVQDSDRIREERKKAKTNRGKYKGFSGGSSMTGFGSSSSRSGGFGSSGLGSSGFGSSGFGSSGFGSSGFGSSGFGSSSKYTGFGSDSYTPSSSNRYDDRSDSEDRTPSTPATSSSRPSKQKSLRESTPVNTKPKEPVVADLFSFDDDFSTVSSSAAPVVAPNAATTGINAPILPPAPAPKATTANVLDNDDDWGDFQSSGFSAATSTNTAAAAPIAAPTATTNASLDLLGGDDLLSGFQPITTSSNQQHLHATSFAPLAQAIPSSTTTSTPASMFSSIPLSAAPATKPAANSANSLSNANSSGASKPKLNDIWAANSDLLSLDSLSLSSKSKTAGSGQKQRVTMNQMANPPI